jgi:hypothetical protein
MMKSIKFLCGALVFASIVGQFWVNGAQASVQDFTIPTFDADYYLSRDAQHISHLRVHEHIVANFPETDQNHGILRALPSDYEGHSLNLHIQGVTDDAGIPEIYTTTSSNKNIILQIGVPGRFVHGLQNYDIDYTMDNVSTGGLSAPAHIWNANGNQWQQPFGQVTARLHLTSDLSATLSAPDTKCFTGPTGSSAQGCTITTQTRDNSDTVTTFTATRGLEPGETLTYQVEFASGTFVPYTRSTAELMNIILLIVIFYVLPFLLTLSIVVHRWIKYGRDPKGRGVIVPQYEPPKGLTVLGSSAILKESFNTKAVSAQIIDLAVRHYLKIYEVKSTHVLAADSNTYELELISDPGNLNPNELAVLRMLFPEGSLIGAKVRIDSLKNLLFAQASVLGKNVNTQLVAAGYFRNDPSSIKAPYFIFGAILIFCSFFLSIYSYGLFLPGVILLISARFMSARTQLGVDTHDYLLGLKVYMKLTEEDRIKLLQSPNGELTEKIPMLDNVTLVKLYERLLPYAMLFEMEQDWAKQFAGLYTQSPDWYFGNSSFSAGYFAGSIANFSTASSASFSPPASSGGGGFAGGGGGGGGGGGW